MMFFSLNTCKFGDFVDLIELEIKYTTYTARSASYLDLYLKGAVMAVIVW
jgi:hypothetical protein